ncbi:MAG: hypothetical protein ISR65_04050 [Bacteriovoracaceae bacterium]|nr:hypothetical protein [Bacteriovoracaceae bacterium]
MSQYLRSIFYISKYTFLEILKSKIMMNVVLFGAFLIFLCLVASEFTYGVPQKVALDIGLGILSIASVGISIFMGVNLLAKEIETRTIYMILSRPIRRSAFLFGKLIGMAQILLLNICLWGILVLFTYYFLGGSFQSLIIWSIFFSFLEALIILCIVTLFSLITNPTMSVIYSICMFIVGHATSETLLLVKKSYLLSKTVKFIFIFFPNLSKLNIKQHVLYKQSMSMSYLLGSSGYALIYILIVILICILIFRTKRLD